MDFPVAGEGPERNPRTRRGLTVLYTKLENCLIVFLLTWKPLEPILVNRSAHCFCFFLFKCTLSNFLPHKSVVNIGTTKRFNYLHNAQPWQNQMDSFYCIFYKEVTLYPECKDSSSVVTRPWQTSLLGLVSSFTHLRVTCNIAVCLWIVLGSPWGVGLQECIDEASGFMLAVKLWSRRQCNKVRTAPVLSPAQGLYTRFCSSSHFTVVIELRDALSSHSSWEHRPTLESNWVSGHVWSTY